MSKPESYPFLRIAKQYGVPYSEVLIWADYIRSVGYTTRNMHENFAYTAEVNAAILEFQAIQRGEIDWLTGEPRADAPLIAIGILEFRCAICGKTECDGHDEPVFVEPPLCSHCGHKHYPIDCCGHVASGHNPKICARCGIHIDSLRPDDDDEMDYGDGRERF